ncbi:MAG: DNA polymerase III subunit gamma/tau [Caldisericia bacterium]|nr:DNA polymerase III subunit gamma/tau [Caldisericia bacterium]
MSENYISLYRKWRSQDLEQIIGQEFAVRTLTNALKSRKIAHAYLFCGPRGTGKTSFARILAKSVNCQEGITPTPCQVCNSCVSIKDGTSLDVIEIDAASNRGVDDIRELREKVKFAPVVSRYKVYIIDEVHMLTDEAFNALLKTLEEPPPHVIFVLATTEPHKIPVTILSRCMRFDLKRIPTENQVQLLRKISDAEKIDISDEGLRMIAIESNGSLRDAESMLDQIASFSEGHIDIDQVSSMLGMTGERLIHELVMAVASGNSLETINIVRSAFKDGREPEQISKDLLARFHILLLASIGYSKQDLAADYAINMKLIEEETQAFQFERLRWIESRLRELVSQMRYVFSALGSLEIALLDLIFNNGSAQAPTLPPKQTSPTPKTEAKPKMTEPEQSKPPVAQPKTEAKPAVEQPVEKKEPAPEAKPVEVVEPTAKPSTSQPSTSSGGIDRFKQIAKESDIILYAFLSRLIGVEVNGSSVALQFPSDAEFEKARLTEPTNIQKLTKIASKVFEKEMTVQVKLAKIEGGNILEDEQVKRAQDLFGGKTEVN